LNALLGGSSIYEKKLTIMMCNKDNWLTIFLKRNSTSSTSSTVLYLVGITEFLTNVIRFIRRSFRLMMKWYYVESTVAKSVDVEMIRQEFSPPNERSDTDSVDNTNTENITRNNVRVVIMDELEKLETITSKTLL